MRSWRKSLVFLTQCLYTHLVLSEVRAHVCFLECGLADGLIDDPFHQHQQVHNQKQAWKSLRDLRWSHELVVGKMYLPYVPGCPDRQSE